MKLRLWRNTLILAGMAVLIALAAVRYWQSREADRLKASIETIPFHTLTAHEESAEDANADSSVSESCAVGIVKFDKIDLQVPSVKIGTLSASLQNKAAVVHAPVNIAAKPHFGISIHRSEGDGK